MVRDVFCKNCNFKLGWMYEFAHEQGQQYKEGTFLFNKVYRLTFKVVKLLLIEKTFRSCHFGEKVVG